MMFCFTLILYEPKKKFEREWKGSTTIDHQERIKKLNKFAFVVEFGKRFEPCWTSAELSTWEKCEKCTL